jgi:hypothetical protein
MSLQPSTETVREKIESSLTVMRDVRFDPEFETLVAFVSLLGLWSIYYFQSVSDSTAAILVFLLVGNFGLTILFPLYYTCYARGEPLSAVGITTDGWKRAVVASFMVAVLLIPGLLVVNEPAAVLVPHVITVGLMFWEPFFVHGWLQIRFERAFGAGASIPLTAAAFALFHVGATTATGLLVLSFFGLVHAILFRAFNRNLLVLWPILWAIGGSQGTLDSVVFGFEEASAYLVILLATGALVYYRVRSRK